MGHVFGTIAPILGGIVGTAIAPGIGTAIGAGLGSTVGGLSEGKGFGQSALGGLETGALAGVGGELAGSLGGAAGNALSGTMLGNALGSIGSEASSLGTSLGITGPGGLTSEVSGLGSDLGITGQGGLTSEVTSGLGTVGKDLGITGPGGLTSNVSNWWNNLISPSKAITGGTVSNPALASALTTPGNITSKTPGVSILPSTSGSISGDLGGGKGGGLFGGSTALGLLSAAPIALDVLRGNQAYKGQNQLQESAAQLGQQGTQLQSYLQTGTLPPGAQAAINQATESAKAAIRSQYAAMGMSGSSAEAQDIAAAEQSGVTQGTNMAMQLLNSGIQSTQMSDTIYQDILNQSMQQDQDLSSAIGNFASMAAGGTGVTGGKSGSINVSI